MGCDGWLTIYIANSPIIIDHHRSPTLCEVIDFSITSHFQMASTGYISYKSVCGILNENTLTDSNRLDKGVMECMCNCQCVSVGDIIDCEM